MTQISGERPLPPQPEFTNPDVRQPEGEEYDGEFIETDAGHIREIIAESCRDYLDDLLTQNPRLRTSDPEDYDILRCAVGMKAQEVMAKHEIVTGSAGQIAQLKSVICLKNEETGDIVTLPEDSLIHGTIEDIWAGDPVADADESSQLIEPLLVLANVRLPEGSLSTASAPLPENGTYYVSLAYDFIHMSFLNPVDTDEQPGQDTFTPQPHAL